jgi:hypothetical protein
MRRPRAPLFLARAPYRQRRLRDAARLLPIFGTVLLLLPLLWPARAEARLAFGDVVYFFAVWAFLIAVAAVFARGLRRGGDTERDED